MGLADEILHTVLLRAELVRLMNGDDDRKVASVSTFLNPSFTLNPAMQLIWRSVSSDER